MKKKFLGRLLTMLLVAAMVFTLLPASAIAADWWGSADEYADDVSTQAATDDYKYNIFFLDCGRKYYSVDSIKKFIDNASAAGFNYIQLAVGNDGLRFLLNDMSLTVDSADYSSDAVTEAIHRGNEAYYNFDVDELTQFEMDTIISYAASKGMGVIPCINTPGHMDAILSAATSLTGKTCSYNGSARTIDVTNDTAVAFTQALLQKYIAYFAGKGCQLFNMGADEYANDKYTTGSMGFGNLQSSGKYSSYVTYVNTVANLIKAAGMTPMAFNDGIYFAGNTTSGTFDTDILICYWSNGWNSYSPMSASDLAGKGFKLINTNGSYYWVLGKTDAQCSADKARGFDTTSFPGSTISNPAGSMFCVWADYPGAETEASVISKTADTIAAFGGALPQLAAQPTVTITAKDNNTKLDLTNPDETLLLTASEVVTWHYDSSVVTLTSADEATSNAFSTYAVDSTVKAKSVYVQAASGAAATDTEIKVVNDSGKEASLTVTLSDPNAKKDGGTINLTVDEEKSVTINGSYDKAEVEGTSATAAVKPTTEKQIGSQFTSYGSSQSGVFYNGNGNYMVIDANGKISSTTDINKATEFTVTRTGSGNYYRISAAVSDKEYYLCLVSSYGQISLGTQTGTYDWSYLSYYGFYRSSSYFNYFIYYGTSSWTVSSYYYDSNCGLYSVSTKPGESSTTITFTGVAPGTTYVTVGDTKYTIIVDYKQETVNVVLDQTKTVPVEGTLNASGLDTSIAEVTVSGTNMTVTGKEVGDTSVIVGNTKYNIHVSTEDLEGVEPAKLEYWITNRSLKVSNDCAADSRTQKQGDKNSYTAYYLSIPATTAGINSADGLPISQFAPSPTTNLADSSSPNYVFWLARMLDTTKTDDSGSKNEEQTTDSGDDNTLSGTEFTKIRYYGHTWSVYNAANNEWVSVTTDHQLVAYYMQRTEVTQEVTTDVVDWAPAPKDLTWNVAHFAVLDFAVKYETGDRSPDTFANAKTIAYAFDTSASTRQIGRINAVETSNYEVYMITLTPNDDDSSVSVASESTSVTNGGYKYNGTEKVIWVDDEADLGDFADASTHHEDFHVGGAATISGITLIKRQGVLVTYYVRAKATEDSLKVNYYDMSDLSKPFYDYNIAVKQGTYFDSDIGRNNPWKGPLANGTVKNFFGNDQTVSADLSTMPAISAEYRYVDYTCVKVEPVADENGNVKTVNLYYTFDNTVAFIADFGRPVTLNRADINANLAAKGVSITKIEASGVSCGKVTTNNDTMTYTPDSRFAASEKGDTFTLTYTGQIIIDGKVQEGSVSYRVTILPASNVLYEENFLTQDASASTEITWTLKAGDHSTAQQTQKVGETGKYVFGYDKEAYGNQEGENGVWATTNSDTAKPTKPLVTSFYGNAFDLIGNCAKDSGRVILVITNQSTGKGYIKSIDTRYANGNLYQVPLAHVELGEDAVYEVAVQAVGLKASGSSSVSTQAMHAPSSDPALQSVLREYGLTMADVEYIDMSGASASASTANRIATYAATIERPAGTHVEIEGFRVYRSSDNANYPAAERGISYVNVLNNVVNVGTFTAFVEGNGTWTTVDNYEVNGGPQNEIYLRSGSNEDAASDAVAFKVTPGSIVQISARAVESDKSATLDVNGTSVEINANTEMYYEVTASDDGIVTIKNGGSGMLALGNLKVKSGTSISSLSEEDYPVAVKLLSMSSLPVDPEPEQPTAFVPEHFSIRDYATRFFRSKLVTLRIDFSKDVSYVEIDGRKYTPNKLASWFGYYTVTFTDTIGRNDDYLYKVVFFDANGNPSETQIVSGK